ncbi:MAG: DUF4271 domain-containing protein [Bacteroidetes bacterium]|nr:MAG: DUF4271 domain-containing protein [Bacteroidota bacterium]MBL1143916.1 DUF4271 domain-containing protein [Bacteroidota bacterium]
MYSLFTNSTYFCNRNYPDSLEELSTTTLLDTTQPQTSPPDLIYIRPYEPIDSNYWFSEFAADVLEVSETYASNLVFIDGSPKPFVASWLLLLLILSYVLLAYTYSFHHKRFNLISKTVVNWKLGKQIIRYEKIYSHPVNISLITIFLIAVPTFFAFLIFNENILDHSLTKLNIILFVGLSSYLFLKFALYRFSAWLLDEKELIQEYAFHVNLLNKFLGIIFLILLSLLVYSNISSNALLLIALFFLSLSVLIQLFRGFRIGLQKTNKLNLIILYLCTLEILPLALLVKLLTIKL